MKKDRELRKQIIRLAHENPKLRKDLLPLVKTSSVGGQIIMNKLRTVSSITPIDPSPFFLAKHPHLKKYLRKYLEFLHANPHASDLTRGWAIMPSSVKVEMFIDAEGLKFKRVSGEVAYKAKNKNLWVVEVNQPNKNHTEVAPYYKSQWFVRDQGTFYPAEQVQRGVYYVPHLRREIQTRDAIKGWVRMFHSGFSKVVVEKGKVTRMFRPEEDLTLLVASMATIDRDPATQKLFLGNNLQPARMSYDELKAIIVPRLRRVNWHIEVLREGRGENGGVALKHDTEMDWEYDQDGMNRREFNEMFYGRMERVHEALRQAFPEFEIKQIREFEDGKRIDYEVIQR